MEPRGRCLAQSPVAAPQGEFLGLDDRRILARDDRGERDGTKIPGVDADIAGARGVGEAPMRVPVEVTRPAPQAWPSPMSVVREEEPPFRSVLVVNNEPQAFDRRIAPGQIENAVGIMVAANEALAPVQPCEDIAAIGAAGIGGEVAEMPDIVIRGDDLVPGGDERLIVPRDVSEHGAALAEDVAISEMRVGGEECGHRRAGISG